MQSEPGTSLGAPYCRSGPPPEARTADCTHLPWVPPADPASFTTVSDHWSAALEVNADENQEIAQRVLRSYRRIRPLFLSVCRWVFKMSSGLRVVGLEHLPATGPCILAANHECHLDSLFVACQFPRDVQRRMVVLSKKEHFVHPATRFFARLCHGIPVDRAQMQISPDVLGVCWQVLRQGGVLMIHPEGTRSPDGRLQPFKKGVAVLAHHARCPVVPIHIEGGYEFWPKRSFFPRSRGRIVVTIGPPIYWRSISSPTAREFIQKLRTAIAALGEGPRGRIGSGGADS